MDLLANKALVEQENIPTECANDFYAELLTSFVSKNIMLQMLSDVSSICAFIYSAKTNRIEYVNDNFQKYFQLSMEHFKSPAISRFIYSRIHPDDARFVKKLENSVINGGHSSSLNKVFRIRMHDNIYHPLLFMIFKLSIINQKYEHLKIGIQIDFTSFEEDHLTDSEYQLCQKKITELSNRERDILRQVVKGHTDNEIAIILHLSFHTVQKHRKNILKKLQIRNTAILAYIAGKSNLI